MGRAGMKASVTSWRARLLFTGYVAAVVAVAVYMTQWPGEPKRERVAVYSLEGVNDIGDARVVSCVSSDPRVLQAVLSSTHLEKLWVGYVDVSGVDFSRSAAKKLVSVEFETCAGLGRNAGSWIARLPLLDSLSLRLSSASREFYSEAAASESLKALSLWQVEGEVEAGAKMCNAKTLSNLALEGIELNGHWRDALASASVLQKLYIVNCRLTPDFTLESIPSLKELRELMVRECEGANEATFKPLLRATQLSEVKLNEQDGVTSDFLEDLRKQLPDAQVYPKVYPK